MIRYVHIPEHTAEWYAWRMEHGYGASEATTTMAQWIEKLAEIIWTSPHNLHMHRIHEPMQEFTGNEKSWAGQSLERHILNLYRYWDHDDPKPETCWQNKNAGKKINKVYHRHSIMQNTKYSWLYFSPDAVIKRHPKRGRGFCECKNTTSMETNRYPGKINPVFFIQCQVGLMVSEFDYAVLLKYVDGYSIDAVMVLPDADIQKQILTLSGQAWSNVLKARILKEKHNIGSYYGRHPEAFSDDQKQAIGELQALEPDYIGKKVESEAINALFPEDFEELNEMDGVEEQEKMLWNRRGIMDKIDELTRQKDIVETRFKRSLNGSNVLNFEKGRATYKLNKKKIRSLYVSPRLFQ